MRILNGYAGLLSLLACVACVACIACDACDGDRGGGGGVSVSGPTPAPPSSAAPARAPRPSFEQMVSRSQPLAPKPEPQELAGEKLVAQACRFDGKSFLGKSTMDVFKAIEAIDDRLLLVDSHGAIHALVIDAGQGCVLRPDAGFGAGGVLKLPHKIESLSRDAKGRLYASNGIFAAYVVKDGRQELVCDTKGHIEIHASGEWGIAPWVNATVRMVELTGTGCKSDGWVLADLNDDTRRKGPFTNVNSAAVIGDLVWIGGVVAKKENPRQPRIVVAYTKGGDEKVRFGGDETGPNAFGWVHAIEPCGRNVCVLDSNFRKLSVWTRAGKRVGSLKLAELFDLPRPWTADFTVAKDGTAWFAAAHGRGGSGVAEGIVMRVRGL